MTALLDRAGIRARIPHAGTMCLLDEVLGWDATNIRCVARSHADPGNPLRRDGVLRSICGVEYAAQAMALHSALLQEQAGVPRPERPPTGYLVSVREVVCAVPELDRGSGDLTVEAVRVLGQGDGVIYGFAVRSGGQTLVSGRATVVLSAESGSTA